jgi:predicted P-loop ATPase
MNRITLIRSIDPPIVCKRYTDGPNGIEKSAVANVNEGMGKGFEVPDAAEMVRILKHVTSSRDLVIVAGGWANDDGAPFKVYSEGKLCQITGGEKGRVPGGVIDHNGERISARLKRGISPSAWVLLDADNPPGIPPEWAAMTIGERLELWEAILPGISKVERIEMRGSSARVLNGSGSRPKTHAWIRVNKPENIALMKAWVGVEMVNKGLSFRFEKQSRIHAGEITGIESRSVFDLAVFDTGRIVFVAEPDIQANGYTLDDAGIEIVNEGGGELDIAWLTAPSGISLFEYKQKTGIALDIKAEPGKPLSIVATGQLTFDTEIVVRGEVKTLGEWAATLAIGEKLRCESPFRESHSEAAFIRIGEDGEPFVHDVGNGVTYRMLPRPLATSRTAAQIAAPPANGSAPAAPPQDWTKQLLVDGRGNVLANPENLRLYLVHHDAWRGVLTYDEFVERTVLIKPIPGTPARGFKPRDLADHDAFEAVSWFNRNGFPKLSSEFLVDSAMKSHARLNAIHPIRHYLDSLGWDGRPRLDRWLEVYCGSEPQPGEIEYYGQVGAKFFIGAVARAYRPGVKVDAALILEGPQGAGKSTALRILCGDAYFGDNLPSMSSKDASSYIRGKWIVELGELAAMQRSEVEIVKAFISRTEERFRPAYGRNEVRYPRQCVFVGTTNRSDFLRDETGNRRFWPVSVGRVDIDAIERDRDQLWAEAVHRFNGGELWWLEGEVAKVASEVQESRVQEDAWRGEIANYLATKAQTSIADIAIDALAIEKGRIDTLTKNRILGVLTTLKWTANGRFKTRDRNRDATRYVAPKNWPPRAEDEMGLEF